MAVAGYYNALIAAWNGATQPPSGVTGTALTSGMTTAQKLTAVNGWTVPGPNQNVEPSQVAGYLLLNGKLPGLIKYAAAPPSTAAGVAGASLVALFNMASAPTIAMAQAAVYTVISAMLTALAGDANSGITSTDATNLLALAAPPIPWWQANGYSTAFTLADLSAAGGLS